MSIAQNPAGNQNLEQLFDEAVYNSNYDEAREIADTRIESLNDLALSGRFPAELATLAMKRAALPLYERFNIEANGRGRLDDMPTIEPVYRDMTEFIHHLSLNKELASLALKGGVSGLIRGALSESIIMALTTRYTSGVAEDTLTIVPARFDQDKGPKYRKSKSRNSNFDFAIHRRGTRKRIHLQVKTFNQARAYSHQIDVVRLIPQLVNAEADLKQLQDALIDDGRNEATPKQVDRIESAAFLLFNIYDHRLEQLGAPTTLANNL